MNKFALSLLAPAVLWAGSAWAQQSVGSAVSTASGATSAAVGERSTQTSEHRALQCSKDNPYIEYRDCVNASTRDSNAKVRMAQVTSMSVRRG